eukprot:COSAG02_NODE_1030_length_15077_cov_36.210119_14_plen_59_part_00
MQYWDFTAISDLCSASNYEQSELSALSHGCRVENGGCGGFWRSATQQAPVYTGLYWEF